jgi:hypothetical protein
MYDEIQLKTQALCARKSKKIEKGDKSEEGSPKSSFFFLISLHIV